MIRFFKVPSALVTLMLITGSAQASLSAIGRIPQLEPEQNLRQFKPIVVVIFPDLQPQQERAMSERTEVELPEKRTRQAPPQK